jgi:hypothetical protein
MDAAMITTATDAALLEEYDRLTYQELELRAACAGQALEDAERAFDQVAAEIYRRGISLTITPREERVA